ncbi:hypothetical protein R3I94_001240 [Phoxinus phoxinus]
MASSNPPRRRNSMDERPDLVNEVVRLREEFIRLYERDHGELQQCIESLRRLINTFEEDLRRATEVTRGGGLVGIAGGVTMIAGLALAPFTLGASVIVAGTGTLVALGGGIGSGLIQLMTMNQQKKLRQNVKNGLEEFQNKIIPMTEIMKVICQYTDEILSDLNKPEHDISGFSKFFAGTSEVVRFIRIDDVGEVAAQMSKTVRLTGTLTGIFTAVSLVLDVLSVMEDNQALDDMDKLAHNGQISESEIKSKAVKFIVEMRKVINGLQNIMDELKKTKDSIVKGIDLL